MKLGKTISAFGCIHGSLVEYTKIPRSDYCVIVGDIMPMIDHSVSYQEWWFKNKFLPWLEGVPCKYKLFCFGNHDFWPQSQTAEQIQNLLPENSHYFLDTFKEIDGVRFFGSPWVSGLGRWAFNKEPHDLEKLLDDKITATNSDIDVFFAHSAPLIGDIGKSLDRKVFVCDPVTGFFNKEVPEFGNEAIANIIYKHKPALCLHSHIHSGDHKGLTVNFGQSFVCNVAYLNEDYKAKYKIRQFEV